MCSKKTQTMEMVNNDLTKFSIYNVMSKKWIDADLISSVFDILKDSCDSWNSLQDRGFGVLVYMILKSSD